jgi:hypothetical protein
MVLRPALASLNRRLYAPFPAPGPEWEGRDVPEGYGPAARRVLHDPRPAEARLADGAWQSDAFLFHYRLGLRYGYPECCVLQYACEATCLRPLDARRGITFGPYVPCDACLDRYLAAYLDGAVPEPAVLVPVD